MVESKVVQQQCEDAEKKVVMKDLQQRLADAELRVREGELLRRKLHNTILVWTLSYIVLLIINLFHIHGTILTLEMRELSSDFIDLFMDILGIER